METEPFFLKVKAYLSQVFDSYFLEQLGCCPQKLHPSFANYVPNKIYSPPHMLKKNQQKTKMHIL